MNSNKRYNNNKPYLLVDSSYVSYYRFFSTLIWYTNTYYKQSIDSENLPDVEEFQEDYDWTTNKIFMERYDKFYMGSIEKIRSRYNIPYENVVIVRDCPRETIWRMQYYPEYKETRKNTCKFKNKKYNIGNIFKHIYAELYPEIEAKYKIRVVKFDNAEADDVIAVLCKKLREIDESRLIVIITNDNDYLQLVDNKTLIWSLQNKLLNTKVEKPSRQILLKKILGGDVSDNIPACLTDISEDELNALIADEVKLKKRLDQDENLRERFNRNKKMIDFDEIPDQIRSSIFSALTDFFPKIEHQLVNQVQNTYKNNYNYNQNSGGEKFVNNYPNNYSNKRFYKGYRNYPDNS